MNTYESTTIAVALQVTRPNCVGVQNLHMYILTSVSAQV